MCRPDGLKLCMDCKNYDTSLGEHPCNKCNKEDDNPHYWNHKTNTTGGQTMTRHEIEQKQREIAREQERLADELAELEVQPTVVTSPIEGRVYDTETHVPIPFTTHLLLLGVNTIEGGYDSLKKWYIMDGVDKRHATKCDPPKRWCVIPQYILNKID